VVTAISGASRGEVRIVGESAHAGATPMPLRLDALAAAAVMISAIERRAQAEPELVATVGRLEIADPAANTVPGAARFSLDVRAPDDAVRKAAVRDIGDSVAEIARLRGVQAEIKMGYEAPSSLSDPALSDGLAASIDRLGLTVRRLSSGAGHDAMAFRGRIPFAMLFVRCRGGVSHNPAEYAAPEDVDIGAKVLLDFVERLMPRTHNGD
jgi:allantoate deiminase